MHFCLWTSSNPLGGTIMSKLRRTEDLSNLGQKGEQDAPLFWEALIQLVEP